jgi:anthranilate synthase component I
MFYPSKKEFIKLAKKGNLIPVYKEIVADMETPVSAFRKIESDNSYLLESVEGGERIGRYSFLGGDPIMTIKAKGRRVDIVTRTSTKTVIGDPFLVIREVLKSHKPVKIKGLPSFHGGLVGYMSYDTVRHIENIPNSNPDDLKLPDMQFMLTDTILAFDRLKHKIFIISNVSTGRNSSRAYDLAIKKIKAIESKLKKPLKPSKEINFDSKKKAKFRSNFTKAGYENVVRTAKKFITSGDIIQVVPSQRITTNIKGDPFDVYRTLRGINPSPYMYYLKFGDMKLIGTSPETMVKKIGMVATVRPIAGTRKRGMNDIEDNALAKDLLNDEKEKAEHIMLVDLGRNDLGRVCKYNTVKINEFMTIEKYSHVMHIVSDISGSLKPGKDSIDLIKASFPAGTVTGAPKVRAMEIIDMLENVRRGPYAGAVGYFSFSDDLDTCITIRTIVVKGNRAYIQAGAGLVYDSVPSKEYEETLNKARALMRAIEIAQG